MTKPFKRLDAYSGRLTSAQAAAGIKSAVLNARSLLADARLCSALSGEGLRRVLVSRSVESLPMPPN